MRHTTQGKSITHRTVPCVTTFITIGTIGYGLYQATSATDTTISKSAEKVEAETNQQNQKMPVRFPPLPNYFNPIGLIKVHRTGTKNGAIISWMEPVTRTEVFRWDENPNYPNGPHYHILGNGHYYAGDVVPEPYATFYFPSR